MADGYWRYSDARHQAPAAMAAPQPPVKRPRPDYGGSLLSLLPSMPRVPLLRTCRDFCWDVFLIQLGLYLYFRGSLLLVVAMVVKLGVSLYLLFID